jgi:hydrogenase maturation protease
MGWQVAVELFRTNTCPDVTVLPCHQLTPDLAEPLRSADTVLFIDCARQGKPGEVHCEEVSPQAASVSFTHDLSPASLLALTSELYGVCPHAYLLSVCGECYEPGEGLSPAVRPHVPELKGMVHRIIEECLDEAVSTR